MGCQSSVAQGLCRDIADLAKPLDIQDNFSLDEPTGFQPIDKIRVLWSLPHLRAYVEKFVDGEQVDLYSSPGKREDCNFLPPRTNMELIEVLDRGLSAHQTGNQIVLPNIDPVGAAWEVVDGLRINPDHREKVGMAVFQRMPFELVLQFINGTDPDLRTLACRVLRIDFGRVFNSPNASAKCASEPAYADSHEIDSFAKTFVGRYSEQEQLICARAKVHGFGCLDLMSVTRSLCNLIIPNDARVLQVNICPADVKLRKRYVRASRVEL